VTFCKTAIIIVAAALSASAQTPGLKFDFPKDTPVTVISSDPGQSKATMRGGAYVLDLHYTLSLRNSSKHRVRGITVVVLAQEGTPGGKATVRVPSLNITPNDTFPLRIDLKLVRPMTVGQNSPSVEVQLDGVLFEDLSFYGPDKLDSHRSMTLLELEAQRERTYFKALLETAGQQGLQDRMVASIARDAERTQPSVEMVSHATNAEPDREMQFAFLQVPDSPIEPKDGTAKISGNEARAPWFEVKNRSPRPVKYFEIGWIVKDQQGHEFMAASMPAELAVAPGRSSQVVQEAALRFSDKTSIQSMRGFVSSVGFADGTYWIPSRSELDDPSLRGVVAPSPEEQRLISIYRKKGLTGLMEELKKF